MTQTASRKPQVVLIAAMGENRVIGSMGKLPWHVPEDLKRFKRITSGHAVLMGRKTFDSIDRRPLPKRRNIILTRDKTFRADGVEVAHTLTGALRKVAGEQEVFILGGQQVYEQAMKLADRIYLTIVHATPEGDAFFPRIDPTRWEIHEDEPPVAPHDKSPGCIFFRYDRRKKTPRSKKP